MVSSLLGLALVHLNMMDTALTCELIGTGAFSEGNPFMALLWGANPLLFVVFKLGVVGPLCLLLGYFAGLGGKLASWGLSLCLLVYVAVVARSALSLAALS